MLQYWFTLIMLPTLCAAASPPDLYAAPEERYSALVCASDNARPFPEPTEFSLSPEADALVVTIQLSGSHLPMPDTRGGAKNGVWPEVESIELFFDPASDGKYFQLAAGLDGTRFDSRSAKGVWHARWTVEREFIKPGQWRMRFRLPYGEHGVPRPATGDQWRFNLCRNAKGAVSSSGTFARLGAAFHTPEKFVRLGFGSPADFRRASGERHRSVLQTLEREIAAADLTEQMRESVSAARNNPGDDSVRALRDEFEVVLRIKKEKR